MSVEERLARIEQDVGKISKAESFFNKYALQIAAIVFLAGGGWVGLDQVAALADENKEAIEEAKERETEIEKKLIRIEVTQEQIKEDLEDQDEKLDKILDKLEEKEEDDNG